jgi:hypothetical protein
MVYLLNLVGREINILHPQLQALPQPEASPIQQGGNQPWTALHEAEDRFHLLPGQNDR